MRNKFKNKETNTWRTRTLFIEMILKSKRLNQADYSDFDLNECLFWLSERLDDTYKVPVLREKFLEFRDPTGMELANACLGGWPHLLHLLKLNWFRDEWDKWQDELFMTIQAENLKKIAEIALRDDSVGLSAAKYLANKEWEKADPAKSTRGRPSRAEVDGALKQEVKKASEATKDYERVLKMTVIPGGRA